jgi:hypothetical protein
VLVGHQLRDLVEHRPVALASGDQSPHLKGV